MSVRLAHSFYAAPEKPEQEMPFSTIKEYKARGLVEVSLTNKISGPYPHLLKLGNYPSCSGRKLKDYYVGN